MWGKSHRIAGAALLLLLAVMWPTSTSVAARAADPNSPGGNDLLTTSSYGFDTCRLPSVAAMQAWKSTYEVFLFYLGGADLGCSQNPSASWVSSVLGQGWDLIPIWVGHQNPCNAAEGDYFSYDTSTAYAQGQSDAADAFSAWLLLQDNPDVPIIADVEAPPSGDTSACRNASRWFIQGWVDKMHSPPGQMAGVYTSGCSGYMDDYSTLKRPPDFIDDGDWGTSPSTSSMACISPSHWTNFQRVKQYAHNVTRTIGGYQLTIDSDCVRSFAYGTVSQDVAACG